MKNSDISIHLTHGLRLEQAIENAGVKTPASITKLTVTGTMTVSDFKYIKKTMPDTLQELDLGNALVKSDEFLGLSYVQSNLISITIPKAACDFNKFTEISTLTSIMAHPDDPFLSTQEGVLFNKDKSKLIRCPKNWNGEYTIPDSVTLVEDKAFDGCSGLTSVIIPNSVVDIGWYTFRGCSGLTFVTIPDSVVDIGYGAFDGCSGLTSITIPNSVTYIAHYAFEGCSGLTSVIIPNSVVNIGSCAFKGCSGLTSVTIPASVVDIGFWAFYHCPAFFTVLPDNPVFESVNGEIRRKKP